MYHLELDKWIKRGKDDGYKFLVIVRDLEDKDIFPVFFFLEDEAKKYSENIISESKLKIIKKVNL